MDRRNFLLSTAAVGMGISTLGMNQTANAASPNKEAEAKLRFCRVIGGISDEDLRWMKEIGFEAIEVGNPGDMESAKNWKKRADDAGLEVASMYLGGAEHPLMSEDPAERQKGLDQAKSQMEIAAAMDCKSIVYVPVRGGQPEAIRDLPERVLWERVVRVLKDLGPMAAELNTNIVLEPLQRGEAWFMRQVSQAAKLCQEAGVPGNALLGDTFHMYQEEANSQAAFIAGGKFVKHVHIGSGHGRVLPNAENHSFPGNTHTDAFRGLKYIGYNRFCSFECGTGGSGDLKIEMPKCMDYLRQCWEEA